ncbi:hypothetical protein cyc_01321 [Cyclospora cayetanensis]|uniref:Uncharacterized protein n=1 Tax=Cyclospora cayetanensis TaxID=88456 RepID=A0A1D3CRE6_9EIME|nr:hypothetical protein cyc_01321 [Cyclospora cayetanensis]
MAGLGISGPGGSAPIASQSTFACLPVGYRAMPSLPLRSWRYFAALLQTRAYDIAGLDAIKKLLRCLCTALCKLHSQEPSLELLGAVLSACRIRLDDGGRPRLGEFDTCRALVFLLYVRPLPLHSITRIIQICCLR